MSNRVKSEFGYNANRRERAARIDLGLALMRRHALPAVSYDCDEIAEWAGVTDSAIYYMELAAMKKLRNRLLLQKDPILHDLMTEFFDRRACAVKTGERKGDA